MEKIKNIVQAIKAWDEKHTNMHSSIYMLLFITAATQLALSVNQAAAAI